MMCSSCNRAALLLGLIGTDGVGAAVAMVPVCATAGSPDPTARLTHRSCAVRRRLTLSAGRLCRAKAVGALLVMCSDSPSA